MTGLPLNVLPRCIEILAAVPIGTRFAIRALLPILNIFAKYLLLGRAVLGELTLLIGFGSLLSGLSSLLPTTGIALSSSLRFSFRPTKGARLLTLEYRV